MEQREKKIEPKNKEEKETDINEKPIGDLLREQSNFDGLLEENRKILKLFSEIEKNKISLYAAVSPDKEIGGIDLNLGHIFFGDLSEADQEDLKNTALILRELLNLLAKIEALSEEEIIKTVVGHRTIAEDISKRTAGREDWIVGYFNNTNASICAVGERVKNKLIK